MRRPILGVDLGTTKCLAAVAIDGKPHDVEIQQGSSESAIFPSLFYCEPQPRGGHKIHLGNEVRSLFEQDPRVMKDVVRAVKRVMRHDATAAGQRDFIKVKSGGREFHPSEVAGEFLRRIRDSAARAEERLARRAVEPLDWTNWLDTVVITVPAYFGHSERQATKKAAQLAGFQSTFLIKEPTAAALTLRVHERRTPQYVLVVDLGGGTCDLTLLHVDGTGRFDGMHELGVFGDNRFGGLEWDLQIAELCHDRAQEEASASGMEEFPPLRADDGQSMPDYVTFGELLESVEQAKKLFCEADEIPVEVQLVDVKPGFDRAGILVGFAQEDFREISQEHADYCVALCDSLLDRVNPAAELGAGHPTQLGWKDLGDVLLVGGGASIPQVQAALRRRFPKFKSYAGTQSAIGRGAAIFGQFVSQGSSDTKQTPLRCLFDTGYLYLDRLSESELSEAAEDAEADGTVRRFNYKIQRNSLLPSGWFGTRWDAASLQPDKNLCLELVVKKYGRWHPEGKDAICANFTVDAGDVRQAWQAGCLRLHFRYNAAGALEYRVTAGAADSGRVLKTGIVQLTAIEGA